MKAYDVILGAMINNKDKKIWKATDFQKEPYFVGYEASARMSELAKTIPEIFTTGKDGRFRTLSINWESEHLQDYINIYGE